MNTILAICILTGYTLMMIKAGGKVPSSLSASVFDLTMGQRWIWTAVICAVCFLCVPTIIDKTSEDTKFLAFIAIAALAFVGAAPLVKDTHDIAYKVHCVAAVICALCSQLVLMFNNAWLLLCWIPFIAYEAWRHSHFRKWRTEVFWAEMTCFASTFAYCLI